MTNTRSDWTQEISDKATQFSKAVEMRFDARLMSAVRGALGKEKLDQDQVVERTGAAMNLFFDSIVGTAVALIAKHANSSAEIEERVLSNVKRWFNAVREAEARNVNH
jgi:hypothetical protein